MEGVSNSKEKFRVKVKNKERFRVKNKEKLTRKRNGRV